MVDSNVRGFTEPSSDDYFFLVSFELNPRILLVSIHRAWRKQHAISSPSIRFPSLNIYDNHPCKSKPRKPPSNLSLMVDPLLRRLFQLRRSAPSLSYIIASGIPKYRKNSEIYDKLLWQLALTTTTTPSKAEELATTTIDPVDSTAAGRTRPGRTSSGVLQ